jgi:hypothetical protein
MADWRQIHGRIRKAKSAQDPAAKLSELFLKTHDAMVAFELAAWHEKAGHGEEAVRWYTIAAQRFRRSDWKTRAHEALIRLGAPIPPDEAPSSEPSPPALPAEDLPPQRSFATWHPEESASEFAQEQAAPAMAEEAFVPETLPGETISPPEPVPVRELPAAQPAGRKRRGRRGGRGRKRPGAAATPPRAAHPAPAPARPVDGASRHRPEPAPPHRRGRGAREPRPSALSAVPPPSMFERAASRTGDPGLSSRLTQLESLLRRLINAPQHALDEPAEAPAGPGVFLVSDADLGTNYYVESCQTLRVALGHLTRKERAARGAGAAGAALRARLAEHLGINEAKASQYLARQCVVRWLQLDDEAEYLAHFAIAVLKTPLNAAD